MSFTLTKRTQLGTYFEELDQSPRIRVTQEGVTASRRFRVNWDDWIPFVGELMGLGTTIGGVVRYTNPLPFPGSSLSDNLFVDDASVDPFDADSPSGSSVSNLTNAANRYEGGALIQANYKQKFVSGGDNPTPPDGTFLTYDASYGSEYLTTPGNHWRWNTDSKTLPIESPAGLVIPTAHHVLRWHNVLRAPHSAISSCQGKLNVSTFLGKPAGTMLFIGARKSTQFAFSVNQVVWQLEYMFAEKDQKDNTTNHYGWNYFWRYDAPSGKHWQLVETVKDNGSGVRLNPYQFADFGALLFAYGS